MSKIFLHTVAILAPAIVASCHSPNAPQADEKTCAALIKQFDDALPAHGNAVQIDKAKSRRAEGAKECDVGDFEDGVKTLLNALKKLGVTPTGKTL